MLKLLVNCCVEETRFDVMRQVITSIKRERDLGVDLESDMHVFDNGSTHPGTLDMIQELDCAVYAADDNLGYWSALNWLISNPSVVGEHKYVYVIENDCVQYDTWKLSHCVSVLEAHPDLGGVRVQEYSVKDRHLYDKNNPTRGSRRYAWVSHNNVITQQPVRLQQLPDSDLVFESNFLSQLPAVNRLPALCNVFNTLRDLESFSEHDYQRLYHDIYEKFGVLDGGIFHCKLTHGTKAITGSWSQNLSSIGYIPTRNDRILQYSSVKQLK